jgi:hypothetical protein
MVADVSMSEVSAIRKSFSLLKNFVTVNNSKFPATVTKCVIVIVILSTLFCIVTQHDYTVLRINCHNTE